MSLKEISDTLLPYVVFMITVGWALGYRELRVLDDRLAVLERQVEVSGKCGGDKQ